MNTYTPIKIPPHVERMADALKEKARLGAPTVTRMADPVGAQENLERHRHQERAEQRAQNEALTNRLLALPATNRLALGEALIESAEAEMPKSLQRSFQRGLRGDGRIEKSGR